MSSEADARLRADADKAAKERAEIQAGLAKTTLVNEQLLAPPEEGTGCSAEPLTKVLHPMVPKPEPVEEAHLYLSWAQGRPGQPLGAVSCRVGSSEVDADASLIVF